MTRLTNHSRWNLFVCITLSLLVAQQVQDARAVEPAAPPDPEALISAALGRPITFAFEETPLDDVVKFFGEKFGISVALDTKALDEVGIGLDTPVTIRLTGISAASAIRHMLRQIDQIGRAHV